METDQKLWFYCKIPIEAELSFCKCKPSQYTAFELFNSTDEFTMITVITK